MTGRTGELSEAEQLRIGAEVIALRRDGIAWKSIEGMFDRERSTLWRYAEALAAKMQQQSPKMQHLGPGPGHEATG